MTRERSSLTTYQKLSPNRTSPRTGKVRRLTPHALAGNLSVEAALNLSSFQNYDPAAGASCNYVIGSDGRAGLCVPETHRAWTTSNRANDQEAITFEISNDGKGPDWHMSDAAINAWLDLAVDIAIFYGYKKVAYYGNKDINGAPDEMIITLHRWWANKACPGDYFIRQLPWLVKEINKRLNDGPAEKFIGEGTKAQVEPAPVSPTPPTEPESPVAAPDSSYTITLKVTALNVRKGPGTSFPVVTCLINDKNTYTIVEESNGPGADKWGRLKSGLGWVALNHTSKV